MGAWYENENEHPGRFRQPDEPPPPPKVFVPVEVMWGERIFGGCIGFCLGSAIVLTFMSLAVAACR